MPRSNDGLGFPPLTQAAYVTPFPLLMAVVAFESPRSNTCFQSHVVVRGSQVVSHPLVVSHT